MTLDDSIKSGLIRMRESIGKLDYEVQSGCAIKMINSHRRYQESYLKEYIEIEVWKQQNEYRPMKVRYEG
jgi:hypothetical protein